MKKIVLFILPLLLLSGCVTTSKIANRLSPGINKNEVIKQCGKPQRKENKENKEMWVYREKLWTEAGYPFILITQIFFQDNKVVEFSQIEEHPKQPDPQEQEARNKAWQDFADKLKKIGDEQREEKNKNERQKFQDQLEILKAMRGNQRNIHCSPDGAGGWNCQ